MIILIAADPDEEFGQEIVLVLKRTKEIAVRGHTAHLSELKTLIAKHRPTVLLIGPGWGQETVIAFAEEIVKDTFLSIIWMVEEVNKELAARARVAGIKNLLQVPVELETLVRAITQSHEAVLNMIKASRVETTSCENDRDIQSKLKTEEIDLPAVQEGSASQERTEFKPEINEHENKEAEINDQANRESKSQIKLVNKWETKTENKFESWPLSLSKLVTVFSTKGGVGKTVIAVNLAVCLAQKKGLKTIIADLDLQSGDVGVMLKLKPQKTIYDCLPLIDQLDGQALGEFLTSHNSGLKTLQAPFEPALADLINAPLIGRVLKAARDHSEFVIVDTPPFFSDNVLTTLDLSDLILLVATMDVPSVKNVKLCLETLRLLSYPAQKIKLVINRADPTIGLRQSEVEKALGLKASLVLPNEPSVTLSVNNGVPMISSSPRSSLSRAIRGFVEELVYAPLPGVDQPDYAEEIV